MVLAIPLGIISLIVKLTSHGPVFYRQERMGLDGKSFSIVKFRSMLRRCRAGDRAGVGEAERSARHAVRAIPATIQPGRAAAALERAARRHVDRRPAAGAAALRRAVQAQDPAIHAPPQGEGGPDRLGAGERLARQHAAREADRVRPLLHRELVGPARPEDHVADARSRGSSTSMHINRGLEPEDWSWKADIDRPDAAPRHRQSPAPSLQPQ